MSRHRRLAVAALAVACNAPKADGGPATSPSAHPVASPPAVAAPARSAAPPTPGTVAAAPPGSAHAGSSGRLLSPATACRAIAVTGDVRAEGGGPPLATGAVLDRPGWLDLSKGSQLVVKHVETTREIAFRGPGRVLPCDRGEERFLLTRGRVETTTWAGARPGAEVLIATPYAAMTYGDAKLELEVGDRGLSLRVSAGDAWLDAGARETAPEKVPAGRMAKRQGAQPDVKALVAGCGAAAAEAEARARDVLSPPGGSAPLGPRAAEHVRARKAARAACGIAAAALGTMEAGPARDALLPDLAASDARWRGVPSPLRK